MHKTIFRDLTLLLVLAFVAMVVWMLPFLNPPAQTDSQTTPPGNVIVTAWWPQSPHRLDVDLWVYGPGEMVPIGYSNLGGLLWNLLRDDLGTQPDLTPMNYENAYTRGVAPGEYIVNVHCYKCEVVPVHVEVEIAVRPPTGGGTKIIATAGVDLMNEGEEVTVLRFKLDKDSRLVPGSMNHLFEPLRSRGVAGSAKQ